jgi:hypothetical protein
MGVRYFVPTGRHQILTFVKNSPFRDATRVSVTSYRAFWRVAMAWGFFQTGVVYSYDPMGRPTGYWQCTPYNCGSASIWSMPFSRAGADPGFWGSAISRRNQLAAKNSREYILRPDAVLQAYLQPGTTAIHHDHQQCPRRLAVVKLEVSILGKSQTSQNEVCASPRESQSWARCAPACPIK